MAQGIRHLVTWGTDLTTSFSSTEPNTPVSEEKTDNHFAKLVPLSRAAVDAVKQTALTGSKYHTDFVKEFVIDDQPDPVPCFVFSLHQLPEQSKMGWRIGKGRSPLPNLGVDLLLSSASNDSDIHGFHAVFQFRVGAGG